MSSTQQAHLERCGPGRASGSRQAEWPGEQAKSPHSAISAMLRCAGGSPVVLGTRKPSRGRHRLGWRVESEQELVTRAGGMAKNLLRLLCPSGTGMRQGQPTLAHQAGCGKTPGRYSCVNTLHSAGCVRSRGCSCWPLPTASAGQPAGTSRTLSQLPATFSVSLRCSPSEAQAKAKQGLGLHWGLHLSNHVPVSSS